MFHKYLNSDVFKSAHVYRWKELSNILSKMWEIILREHKTIFSEELEPILTERM